MSFLDEYPLLRIIQAVAREQKKAVYLVGGFLRDYLLGRPDNDLDFAVDQGALDLAKEVARRIRGSYVPLDEAHACARVAKKTPQGTQTLDFAGFRAPTLPEDLAHRDFTINTLSVNVASLRPNLNLREVIQDHEGRALKDIADKRIRRVSVRSLTEDPLRMMRAFSLKALLGFRLDLSTLNQIRREKEALLTVSIERVREELFKILASARAAETLRAMDKAGLLDRVIPQIRVMDACPQGGYHHLDVWPHSLETVRQLERLLAKDLGGFSSEDRQATRAYLHQRVAGDHPRLAVLKLGALLHDIGKPDTRQRRAEGGFSFHGHERVGQGIARAVARMLKLSVRERHILEDLVLYHLRPGYLSNFARPSERMFFRYFRDTGDEAVSVALLSWADQRATRGPLTSRRDQVHHRHVCQELIRRYWTRQREPVRIPLITGRDLIDELGLKPSPLFSVILTEAAEQQALGQITRREQALDLARRLIKKKGVAYEDYSRT